MKGKRVKKKGFTLAELLIVVAVIAVLVAVAIPTFSNQLEKSRQAVDVATLREAYAAAVVISMDGCFTDDMDDTTPGVIKYVKSSVNHTAITGPIYYNPKTGGYTENLAKLIEDEIVPYGKAHTGKVVADVSQLRDLGITYSPQFMSASDMQPYSAMQLDGNGGADPSSPTYATNAGTTNGGVAVTFSADGKLGNIGFVPLVQSEKDEGGNFQAVDKTAIAKALESIPTETESGLLTVTLKSGDDGKLAVNLKRDDTSGNWVVDSNVVINTSVASYLNVTAPDGYTASFNVNNLPGWLTTEANGTSGAKIVIKDGGMAGNKPAASGTFTVSVTAKNAEGASIGPKTINVPWTATITDSPTEVTTTVAGDGFSVYKDSANKVVFVKADKTTFGENDAVTVTLENVADGTTVEKSKFYNASSEKDNAPEFTMPTWVTATWDNEGNVLSIKPATAAYSDEITASGLSFSIKVSGGGQEIYLPVTIQYTLGETPNIPMTKTNDTITVTLGTGSVAIDKETIALSGYLNGVTEGVTWEVTAADEISNISGFYTYDSGNSKITLTKDKLLVENVNANDINNKEITVTAKKSGYADTTLTLTFKVGNASPVALSKNAIAIKVTKSTNGSTASYYTEYENKKFPDDGIDLSKLVTNAPAGAAITFTATEEEGVSTLPNFFTLNNNKLTLTSGGTFENTGTYTTTFTVHVEGLTDTTLTLTTTVVENS